MSLMCFLGRHTPSLVSISRGKRSGYVALCDACGCTLERSDKTGFWRAAPPLCDRVDDRAA